MTKKGGFNITLMRALFKSLTLAIIFILAVGFCVCVYILQAPPLAQPGSPKLQVHTRTALRGSPTVNSKPIAYTKSVYRFSLDEKYISNLNTGQFSPDLLFSAALAHRARLGAQRLDKELETSINWQKMFSDLTANIRFNSGADAVEVLLSGEEWLLTDNTGASYTIVRVQDRLDVYLPNLKEAFEINKVPLSAELALSIEEHGALWLIKDKKYKQTYEIKKGTEKLNVYQQPKFEIQTFLFEVDGASQPALAEGRLSSELRQGFLDRKISLSRRAKVSAGEDGVSWQVTDPPQKYTLRSDTGRLKIYLALKSKWLRIRVDENLKGWVQSERGTIFHPSPPELSSRQQAKERLLVLIDRLKEKAGIHTSEPK